MAKEWEDVGPVNAQDGWEDVGSLDDQEDNTPSQLEAAALAAAQGATFDFADEGYGAAKALLEKATGDESDLKELYERYRDVARERMSESEKEYPGTYLASEIVGGVVPAFLTGGASAVASIGKTGAKQAAKQLAKAGAIEGGVSGLGATEDISDIKGTAADIGMGTVAGATLGAAIPTAGKGAAKAVKKAAEMTGEGAKKLTELSAKSIARMSDEDYARVFERPQEVLSTKETTRDIVKDIVSGAGQLKKRTIEAAEEGSELLSDAPTMSSKDVINTIRESFKPEEYELLPDSGKEVINNTLNIMRKEALDDASMKFLSGDEAINKAVVSNIKNRLGDGIDDQGINELLSNVDESNVSKFLSQFPSIIGDHGKVSQKSVKDKISKLYDIVYPKKGEVSQVPQSKKRLQSVSRGLVDILEKDAGKEYAGLMKESSIGFDKLADLKKTLGISDDPIQKEALYSRDLTQELDTIGIDPTKEGTLIGRLKSVDKDTNQPILEALETRAKDLGLKEGVIDRAKDVKAKESLESIKSEAGLFGLPRLLAEKGAKEGIRYAASKKAQKQINKVGNLRKNIGDMSSEELDSLASSVSQTSPELGNKLQKVSQESDKVVKDALLWSITQQPAFRKVLEESSGLDQLKSDRSEGWEEVLEDPMSSIESDIDRVNTQQSSGEEIPLGQLDDLLGKLKGLEGSEEELAQIEDQAVDMRGFQDGERLKEMIRRLKGIS
jgi:hypothetical protein